MDDKKVTTLFFNDSLLQDFDWRGKFKLRLGAVLPSNKEQISRGLKYLSSESIRNRFLGSKKEFSQTELDYLTQLDGNDHWAFGIEEREKPLRGIAIARLVRSKLDNTEAEMAIVIIDEYQGIGLGTLLIELVAMAAFERKITRLTFTSLPQNNQILNLVQKIGQPQVGSTAMDYVQYFIELDSRNIEKIKSRLQQILPTIDKFDS